MRPSGTHLYKRVCPSVRPLRKCQNRVPRLFLATMRSYTESNDRQTCLEGFLYYSCRFFCLFVQLSLHICHMFNTRRATARTHLCPVGLVYIGPKTSLEDNPKVVPVCLSPFLFRTLPIAPVWLLHQLPQ